VHIRSIKIKQQQMELENKTGQSLDNNQFHGLMPPNSTTSNIVGDPTLTFRQLCDSLSSIYEQKDNLSVDFLFDSQNQIKPDPAVGLTVQQPNILTHPNLITMNPPGPNPLSQMGGPGNGPNVQSVNNGGDMIMNSGLLTSNIDDITNEIRHLVDNATSSYNPLHQPNIGGVLEDHSQDIKIHNEYIDDDGSDGGNYNFEQLKRNIILDGEDFKCPVEGCDKSCRYKSNMISHIKIHCKNADSYQCPYCSYTTKYKSNLKKHKARHTDEYPFQCPYCPHRSKLENNLKSHMLLHGAEKAHRCPHPGCNYKSHYRSNIKVHMVSHSNLGDKKFKCDLCPYSSNYRSNIISHMHTHSTNYPYRCDQCNYKAKYKSNLKSHIKTHFKDSLK